MGKAFRFDKSRIRPLPFPISLSVGRHNCPTNQAPHETGGSLEEAAQIHFPLQPPPSALASAASVIL